MFYTFMQNNSGGYFIRNNDVREFLIIEADNVEDAIGKMYDITEDYSEYCPCCGERWSDYMDEDDADEVPSIWSEPVQNVSKAPYREDCIIYYKDGRKEIIEFK